MDGQQARAGDGAHRGERLTPRPTPTPKPRPTATPYTSYNTYPIGRTCYVWVDSGRARSGPGTSYSFVEYILQGQKFEVLDRQMGDTGKDWYKIRLYGQLCWISSGLVIVDGN
jgi:hypothetical protein